MTEKEDAAAWYARILADPNVLVQRDAWKARAEAAEARLGEVRDEYEAWNTEGLGTCPELDKTNYPDAWAGIGCAFTRSL